MQILAVPGRFSTIWFDLNFGDAVLKTTAEYTSLIHTFKCDLFTFIKGNTCSHLCVDANMENIFISEPLTFQYSGSHTSKKK